MTRVVLPKGFKITLNQATGITLDEVAIEFEQDYDNLAVEFSIAGAAPEFFQALEHKEIFEDKEVLVKYNTNGQRFEFQEVELEKELTREDIVNQMSVKDLVNELETKFGIPTKSLKKPELVKALLEAESEEEKETD